MESPNPSEVGISFNDVMNRRLKNRERQRRYREKKRLRTDSSKACGIHQSSQSSQMQIVVLPTDVPVVQAVTRVYCKRDWKKDARRAHLHAVNQDTMLNGIASTSPSLAGAKQLASSHSGTSELVKPSNSENLRSKLGRRDWKAEARAKRS